MVDIFIAYSHNDLSYKDELKKFLRPLLREGRISVWDDFDFEAGQDWDATIKERLYGAGIVLLLVSADSLASDYFYGKEVAVSLDRHTRGEATVVPVVLRHCDWTETPLGALETLPEKGRPVAEWPSRDQAFQDIVSRLRRVVEKVEQKRAAENARAEALRRFQASCLSADQLFEHKNWTEAGAAYRSARDAWQAGFSPDRAWLKARAESCDAELRASKSTAMDQHEGQKPPWISQNAVQALLGVVIGATVLLLLLLWQPWDSKQAPAGEVTLPDTEATDFATARRDSSLPALRSFILKNYPKEQFEGEAKQLEQALVRKLETLLNDARQFPDDPATACELLGQAARIDPGDVRVTDSQDKFKCHSSGKMF